MLRQESIRPGTRGLTAPGPKTYWPLGSVTDFRRDPLAMLDACHRQYGDVFRVRVFIWRLYGVVHPDHVRHVLQENHRNYHKSIIYETLQPVVGMGLLTSEDDAWRRQRRILQPAFHRKVLANLVSGMADETEDMLNRWHGTAARDEPLDVLDEMMALTLEIVSRTMLSTDVAAETATVRDSVTVLRDDVNHRMMHVLTLSQRFPTPRNRRFARALNAVDSIIYRLIDERRRGGNESHDLLSMLLDARDEETGQGMTDRQLRDEVVTIFLAGHETTANALAWTLLLVSQHPNVEDRLLNEVDCALGGRQPSFADLPGLPYTRMVIEESLRLYPPVWSVARQALADDEIGGYLVPANSGVAISPWLTHRHPDFWEDPTTFDPERFSPERSAARPKFAYIPFGGGPRQCIGNEFALMEAQLVLAMIAQRFRLRLVPGARVELDPAVTLRPKYGMPMLLAARS